MWMIFSNFFQRQALAIAGWLLAALAVLALLLGARRSGRDAERARNAKELIKEAQHANKARRDVRDAYRRGDVPQRVQKFYIDTPE